jgi:hypothetical protein
MKRKIQIVIEAHEDPSLCGECQFFCERPSGADENSSWCTNPAFADSYGYLPELHGMRRHKDCLVAEITEDSNSVIETIAGSK